MSVEEALKMYVQDGIAYAGEPTMPIKVQGVRPLPDFKLWVRFTTGEAKVFDFGPLLSEEGFKPLSNPEVFRNVYIDYGCTVWDDGQIDIAPEYLYEHGVVVDSSESA